MSTQALSVFATISPHDHPELHEFLRRLSDHERSSRLLQLAEVAAAQLRSLARAAGSAD